MREIKLNDIVQTKKKHPCGSDQWKIIRTGADIKAECCGCGHVILMPRLKFLKILKQ